jgi:hypothetical protein
VHPVDVIIDRLLISKHLLTGWTVVLNIDMKFFHVALEIVPLLDLSSANHADEAIGTYLHLSLH